MRMTQSNRNFLVLLLISALTALAAFCACRTPFDFSSDSGDTLLIFSWNVQNLFDAEEQGSEYDDFIPGDEWTEEMYQVRLKRMAEVVRAVAAGRQDGKKLPDILLLQEVENRGVLSDLNRDYLGNFYPYIFCPRAPGSAVQTAIMSREPLLDCRAHRLVLTAGSPQRYILEATGPGGITFFCNHWKSRLGGEEATAFYRAAAEKLLLRRIGACGGLWVAAGDFNQEPSGFGELGGAGSGWDLSRQPGPGSYLYQGSWERIDHIFLGKETEMHFQSFSVPAEEPWADAYGRPCRWNSWSGEGVSDHLPLLLELDTGAFSVSQ